MPEEELLIDINLHFNHSVKLKEEYQEFLEFCDVAPMNILKHARTRWLSLERCVNRFCSSDRPRCVKRCAFYRQCWDGTVCHVAVVYSPTVEYNLSNRCYTDRHPHPHPREESPDTILYGEICADASHQICCRSDEGVVCWQVAITWWRHPRSWHRYAYHICILCWRLGTQQYSTHLQYSAATFH